MNSKMARELAGHRRGALDATRELINLLLRSRYPHDISGAATVVSELASQQATEHRIDRSIASDMLEEIYRGAADIFGSLCDPRQFVDVVYKRLDNVLLIDIIKRQNGMLTQNTYVEGRLKRQIEKYAREVGPPYEWDAEEAAYRSGRFVRNVLLPAFRELQDRLRQTPSGYL